MAGSDLGGRLKSSDYKRIRPGACAPATTRVITGCRRSGPQIDISQLKAPHLIDVATQWRTANRNAAI
jgi:hypothetical protein